MFAKTGISCSLSSQTVSKKAMKWMGITFMAGMLVLTNTLVNEASNTSEAMQYVLHERNAKRLHTTTTWFVQEYLASLWWLGPLRPNSPKDLLQECGIHHHMAWWTFLVQPYKTRQVLKCLQHHITTAQQNHHAFQNNTRHLLCALTLFCSGMWAILALKSKITSRKPPLHTTKYQEEAFNNTNNTNEMSRSGDNKKNSVFQKVKKVTTFCTSFLSAFVNLFKSDGLKLDFDAFIPQEPMPDFDQIDEEDSALKEFMPDNAMPDIEDWTDEEDSALKEFMPDNAIPDIEDWTDEEDSALKEFMPDNAMPDIVFSVIIYP